MTTGELPNATPIIAAFDLDARELLWHTEQEPSIYMTSDAGRLFVSTDSEIVAVSIIDGSILWQVPVKGREGHYDNVGELLARDGWLFLSRHDKLDALKAQTGAATWTSFLTAPIDWYKPPSGPLFFDKYYAVAYDNDTLYARVVLDISGQNGTFRFMLVALDAQDGRELWRFPFEIPVTQGGLSGGASHPAFSEQAVYFSAFGGVTYALNKKTGKVLWKREAGIGYQPIYINDQIITTSNYQEVITLDARTEDLKWAVPFMDDGIGMLSSFVFSNEHLIFYASDGGKGQLSLVDLKSGKVVSALHPDFPHDCGTLFPVAFDIHSEHLYLVTLDCVHSFQISWRE